MRHAWLAAASGALYCLGFAGFDIWPLALVAWVPLLLALERVGFHWSKALGLGLVSGFVAQAGACHWLVGTLVRFSGLSTAACVALAAALWLYHGAQFAVTAALWAGLRRRGVPMLVVAPAVFVSIEHVYPQLFPAYFANALHDVPVLMQAADLGGPTLLSALLVLTNAAVYEAVRRSGPGRLRVLAVPAVSWLLVLSYGGFRLAEVARRMANARHRELAIVQVNMGSFEKHAQAKIGHARHLAQSDRLQRAGAADLLLWPESSIAWTLPAGLAHVRAEIAPGIRSALIFGALSGQRALGTERRYNSAFFVDEGGHVVGRYDKQNLLPFSETMPFADVAPWLREFSPYTGRLSVGPRSGAVELAGARVSVSICYEDLLAGYVRQQVREQQPQLLVNLTNDAWFGDTLEPRIHLALAKFRAVEHHRALARATNSGVSAVIDPAGRVLGEIPAFERGELRARVPLVSEPSLYTRLGPWPAWLGWLVVLVSFARSAFRSRSDATAGRTSPSGRSASPAR